MTDHLGSVRYVVNLTTGTIVQDLSYDEFGKVLKNTNESFQPFTYAGGLYDHQTGMIRFGARDYDSKIGRWTAKEPLGFIGSFNFYSYCNNDPVNSSDINGLFKSHWLLRALVPGQIAWDNALTAYEQGHYRDAAINTVAMIAEQVATVWSGVKAGNVCQTENSINVVKSIPKPSRRQLLNLFKGKFRIEKGVESIPKNIQKELGVKFSGAIQKPWHIVINNHEFPLNPFNPLWKYFK